MANSRLQQLLTLYFRDLINPDQFRELQELIRHDAGNVELDDFLREAYSDPQWAEVGDYDKEQMYQELISKIARNKETDVPVVSLTPSKRKWPVYRQVAAAAIIMILGTGAYFTFFNNGGKPDTEITATNTVKDGDVEAPQLNRATITLADGSHMFLDSAGNGQLAQMQNIKLVKLANGQIAYQTTDGQVLKDLQYNTLTNPKASKVIDMTLSDGSRVWLNAGSSITYPVAFVGGERSVELKGEGYFEVTHDKSKPFKVAFSPSPEGEGRGEVEVLGTHFNVNAYSESAITKVTLLEGSVRTGNDAGSVVIKPGQQAQIADQIKVVPAVVDQVMAWRNGLFYLNNQSIGEVMQQISNWYDVEVIYTSGTPDVELYGEMGRDLSLSQVLKVLQKVGLKCELENHKLIIQ